MYTIRWKWNLAVTNEILLTNDRQERQEIVIWSEIFSVFLCTHHVYSTYVIGNNS